ncbi:MAG TPA: universal stress protein [Thermohalobaculum sp.]|nr:universal stress protein [Thermohalobaculum sp.]
MPFKTLLVFADDSEASASRLDTAIVFAGKLGAHLTALALLEQPAYYYGIGSEVAADAYLADIERAESLARDTAAAAASAMSAAGTRADTRWATGTPAALSEIVARHARYADLSLVGQPSNGPIDPLLTRIFEGMLFESGRPLVVVPNAWRGGAFGKRVMIAWAPRREAARAVADALPLIAGAERAHIAMVDPETGPAAHGEEPGADLATALARHGVPVAVDQLPRAGQGIADRLLTHAADCGADLIVMGGYGHWRLRESLFGGVTRDVLYQSEIPVLMAH